MASPAAPTLAFTGRVVRDEVIPARAPWSGVARRGQLVYIIDLEGNQAVDCIFYNADDPEERYSAADTIAAQRNIFLTTGTVLHSTEHRPMLTVVEDTTGRHDTIGGACSCESNTLRYGHHTKHQHACVENFLVAHLRRGMGKRDMTSNINWFMNVPVEPDGALGIVDGISAPGKHVALRCEMNILTVISNCPQINNPCNAFNPTPVRVVVTQP